MDRDGKIRMYVVIENDSHKRMYRGNDRLGIIRIYQGKG